MLIKETPEDFVVIEILPAELHVGKEGPFLLLHFTKCNRNSEDVVSDLCKALQVQRKCVSYAGNKDRHAVTSQYVTVDFRSIQVKQPTAILKKLDAIPQTSFSIVGFLQQPLSLGLLAGNQFSIVVRDVDRIPRMVRLSCIPNYFDEQRFSGANADIGRALIKNDFALASQTIFGLKKNPIAQLRTLPKKTLLLYVHAYQSLLFNQTLEHYFSDMVCKKFPYRHGTFLFPKKSVKNISVPLLGFGTEAEEHNDPRIQSIMQQVMKNEQITTRDFVIRQIPELTSEGGMRDLVMTIKDFHMSTANDELHPNKKKATLKFTLPPGSYATIVIKALF